MHFCWVREDLGTGLKCCGTEVLDLLYGTTVSENYRKRNVGSDKVAAFESLSCHVPK